MKISDAFAQCSYMTYCMHIIMYEYSVGILQCFANILLQTYSVNFVCDDGNLL